MGFRDLKIKSKREMKHFKRKMAGIFYILVWRDYQEVTNCGFHCRRYKVLVEVINQQET